MSTTPTVRVEAGFFDWREAVDGDGNHTSAEVPYFAFGASSEGEAITAVLGVASKRIGRLFREEVSIDERINADTYRVLARYEVNEGKEHHDGTVDSETGEEGVDPDPTMSFDTTGGTRHINQSLTTISKTPADATDYGGAIEVDNDGNVNGVDVTMPVMTFSETHWMSKTKVSQTYRKKLFSLTGKVNSAAFRGFEIGEVLFLGASGSRTGSTDDALWEITFKFAVSPSAKDVKVGSNITVPSKAGWDYLWVKYGEKVNNGAITKVPMAAYVERVYQAGDFATLGLTKTAD